LSTLNQLIKIPEKLMASLNLILDPDAIVDLKGNLVAANDRLNEITGFTKV
jgi:hypothetical protein